jgi:U3 small nucleolar RNA-associated protein 22
MNSGFLDVIYPSSEASFRVRIFHDRESLLLDRKISSLTTPPRQKHEAEEALREYRKTFIQLPRHAQDMQRLAHHYPAFSPTVRLVKKWFDAQLLSRHVEEEAMEVIVARCFVYSAPWSIPSTVMSGFLRVITFLALWDWRLDPLLVDLGSDMKRSDFEKLDEAFRKARKNDPGMQRTPSMFIVSDQGMYTRAERPVTVVAARITALAKSASELVGSCGELPVPVMVRCTFPP